MLSIIVPVYNSEPYLPACLKSIVNQSFNEWECLLIDEESTDNSPNICKEFSQKDGRFKYYRKKRGGVADARNYGIEHAKGEYISFADNDDLLHPKMYEYLIKNLENTNSDVSCCKYIKDFRSYDEVNESMLATLPQANIQVIENREEIYYSIVKGNKKNGIEGLVWNKIYRRDVINNTRFDIRVALVDDADFSLRLFKNVNKVCYTDSVLYHWMQHKTNQTTTGSYEKYASAAKAYETMVTYVNNLVTNEETKDILKSQSLIWHINACERGTMGRQLDNDDMNYYKAVIKKYIKYAKCYNKKVQMKAWLILCAFPIYRLYASYK